VLLAGQVLGQYPAQLVLEHLAKQGGLSPAKVWQTARLEHPFSRSLLRVYQELLATLGQNFLQGRYHALLEAERLVELRRAEAALRRANDELEQRVVERTAALEEAQKKALQKERLAAIGQLMAGLAHESRNALQRSQACVEMLQLRIQDMPDALELVARLQAAQDDLYQLYEEVQSYAAPLRLELRVCNVAEIWRQAWANLDHVRKDKQAELREDTSNVNLWCEVSPFHLRQVFHNLLHNALTVASDPIRIMIRCTAAQIDGRAALRISVHDNGPGFTAEQRQKAFDPFFTTKVRGTGLGLPICKRIIEAHGGHIEVAADDGAGAEIAITFPCKSN